jgi:hypothetical protein
VDSAIESQAVGVYQKLGMEVVIEYDEWSKTYG